MKELKIPESLNLEILGERIGVIDRTLVRLIARRMATVKLIGEYKIKRGQDIVDLGREKKRLAVVEQLAKDYGLDPILIQGILYSLINESCKRQFMQVELKQKQFGEDADFSPGVSEKRREEGELNRIC